MKIVQNLFPRTHTRTTRPATIGGWLELGYKEPTCGELYACSRFHVLFSETASVEPYPKFISLVYSILA